MACKWCSWIVSRLRAKRPAATLELRHKVTWALVWALLFSLFPWVPPALTPAVEGALENVPPGMQWTAPLALSVSRWADAALAAWVGPRPVQAGANITLTLVKRDDGPNVIGSTVGPDPVNANGVFVYYVHITNTGNIAATIYFTETLPPELECLNAGVTSQNGGTSWFGACVDETRAIVRTLDTIGFGQGLGAGRGAILFIQGQVKPDVTDGHVFTNTRASYTARAAQEPIYIYTGATDVTTTVRAPRLVITKTDSPDPVSIGGLLTYTLTYSNEGALDATGIVVTDTLDPDVTLVATFPPSDTVIGRSVVWSSLGDLAAGDQGQIVIVVRVSSTLLDGERLANTAAISGDEGAPAGTGPVETVAVGGLHHFIIAPVSDPQTAGVGFTVSITAVDRYSNPVAVNGTVAIVDTAVPNTLQPPTVALSGGRATAAVTITLARADTPIRVGAGLTATNSNAFDVVAGPPETITVTTSRSAVPVGQNEPVTAQVVDRYGNPVSGTVLTFGISAGTVNPPLDTTDGSGVANSSVSHTLPSVATIVVTAGNGVTGSTDITFITGCPNTVVVTITPSVQGVGSSSAITVHVQDVYGNGVDWASVTLAATGLGSGGIADTLLDLDGNGQATTILSSTLMGRKTVLVATVPERGCSTVNGTGVVTFTAGAPAHITVAMSPDPQGVGVNATLYATVTDQFFNPVGAGYLVTFTWNAGDLGGGGVTPATDTTDGLGVATAFISSTLIGGTSVTATLASDPAIWDSEPVSFVAGPPAVITLTVTPAETQSGVNATLRVTMTDQYGNLCAGQPVTFSVTAGTLGAGGFSPNPATANASGVATAQVWGSVVNVVSIQATASTGVNDTVVLTVTGGPLYSFDTSTVPDTVAGITFTLHITAVDAWGNLNDQTTGNIALIDRTGTLAPTGVSMVNGTATVVLSVTEAIASDWITLTWSGPPIVVAQTNVFAVTAGPAATVTLPSDLLLSACISEGMTATVHDMFGNPVSGEWVTFTHSGVGSISPNGGTTGSGGQAVTVIQSTVLGTAVLQASVAGVPPVTATLSFEAGPPSALTLIAATNTISAGGRVALTVTVVDCGGNPVPGQAITNGIVSALSTGDGVVYPVGGTTDSSGQFTFVFTGTGAGEVTIAATLLDDPLIADMVVITVGTGDPVTVTLTALPATIMPNGGQSTLDTQVVDGYGNPVPGCEVLFERVSGPNVILDPVSGRVTTDGNGQASATMTSTSEEGVVVIRVTTCNGLTNTVSVTVRRGMAYLPVVLRNYPIGDLEIVAINVYPDGQGGYEARVTLRNNGPYQAAGGYWVDLYLDPSGPIELNVIWNDVSSQGKAWFVRRSLEPGETLTLSTQDPDDPGAPGDHYSYWPGDLGGAGPHVLWAMADCFGSPPSGMARETNEGNNLFGPVSVP